MKVLALVPTKDGLMHSEALQALYGQKYADYSAMIHTLRPIELHSDRYKNKSLNILRNRNIMRDIALGSDAEWFFWVDSDTVVPENAIEEFLKVGKPLMGGWYPVVLNKNWVAAKWTQDGKLGHFSQSLPGITEVDMLGLGCAFMHRSVLEKIPFTAGTDEHVIGLDGAEYYMGQCATFCRDAQKEGIKPSLLGSIICKHYPTGAPPILRGTSHI